MIDELVYSQELICLLFGRDFRIKYKALDKIKGTRLWMWGQKMYRIISWFT
jgi:hypothetical protein